MYDWKWNGIFFTKDESGNADGGGNSGGKEDNGKTGDENQNKEDSERKEDKEEKPAVSFKTQKEFDDLIAERLKRDREARTDAEKKKAREEAGEYKPLYEELKKKVDEDFTPKITTYEAKLAARDKRLNEIIDGEIANWDESIKSMDPGPEDVDSRSTWVEKARDAAKKLESSGNAPNLDHGKRSGGGGTGKAAESYVGSTYSKDNIPGKK